MNAARVQYYTPTVDGLRGYSCTATMDWNALMTRTGAFSGPNADELLVYLQGVRLVLNNALQAGATLDWKESLPPSGLIAPGISSMRTGIQQAFQGYFQSTNFFQNGTLFPPGHEGELTDNGQNGYRVVQLSPAGKVYIDLDHSMRVLSIVTNLTTIEIHATPHFAETPEGLILDEIQADYRQPPEAPPVHLGMSATSQRVETFLIPKMITLNIRNIGILAMELSACKLAKD